MSWKSVIPHLLFLVIGGGLITFFVFSPDATPPATFNPDAPTDLGTETDMATDVELGDTTNLPLTIPLEQTAEAREQFIKEFSPWPWNTKPLKPLYEKYIDQLGANGMIEALQTARPLCHDEGHDFGKVIYDKLGDIGTSLRVCQDACNSGCMHGVLMEAFTADSANTDDADHLTIEVLKEKINDVCTQETMAGMYRPGDCAHAVGHAVMFLADYSIDEALNSCALYDSYPMAYYCATGAYMEYITTHDAEDAVTQSLFYPCEGGQYPAACFRYKTVHVIQRWYPNHRSLSDLIGQCATITDENDRLGCYHGLGNAHMSFIVKGKIPLNAVCNQTQTNEQVSCIEGAMERMAKFYPDDAPRACDVLTGSARDACLEAANRKMYSLDKSFELYQR